MRSAVLLLTLGLVACSSPSPFEPDTRDPASDLFQPPAPSALGAAIQEDGSVRLTWRVNSTHEEGFIVERRLSFEQEFSEIAVLPPGTTTFTDTPPVASFAAAYRVASFAERGGGRHTSGTFTERSVTFFNPDTFTPVLSVRDERALHVFFPRQLPDEFSVRLQRFVDGQPDGPPRMVAAPLIPSRNRIPYPLPGHNWSKDIYATVDSLMLSEVAYHYEVSVHTENEHGPTLTTNRETVRLGWSSPPEVYMSGSYSEQAPDGIWLRASCTRAPLETQYIFSLVDDLDQETIVHSFVNTPGPPTYSPFVTSDKFLEFSQFEPSREYRMRVRLSSGAVATGEQVLAQRGRRWGVLQ